jgi:hypothetical protein
MAKSTPGLSRLGQAAQAYAKKGWHVFPCKNNAKEPATRSGLHAATIDELQIKRWWMQDDYNIGVVAGPSGLVVVDLDLPSIILDRARTNAVEEVPGICSWNALLEAHDMEWIETTTVVTPRAGLHLYFIAPPGIDIRPSAGTLGPNIDVRAAESYVLAPPSIVNGRQYVVGVKNPLLPFPQQLVPVFEKPSDAERKAHTQYAQAERAFMQDDDALYRFVVTACARLESTALQGSRNETLNAIAYHVFNVTAGRTSVRDMAVHELRRAGLRVGLTEKEIDKTLRSALRAVPI